MKEKSIISEEQYRPTAAKAKRRNGFISFTGTYEGLPSLYTDEYSPDRILLLEDTEEMVLKVITDDTDREIIGWHIDGLDSKAISEMTGLSPNSVNIRMYRIRKRIMMAAA